MDKKFGSLSSSVNPQELSLAVTAGARLILTLLVTAGYIDATGVDTTLETIPAIVGVGYAAFQALETMWGLIRKLIVLWTEKKYEESLREMS
jgi:hypothetical protein